MKYSVIVPVFNYAKGLEKVIWDIHDTCISHMGEYEIVVIDDNSSSLSEEFLREKTDWWAKNVFSKETLRYFRNKINYGFGMSCNLGFERSFGEKVFFVSTDVEVRRDFLSQSDKILNQEDGVRKLLGGILHAQNTGWNMFGDKIFPYLGGWFLGCKSEDFEFLGGFDPIYGRYDYEDVDISTKALAKGFVLEELPHGMFDHYSGRSIATVVSSAERERQTKINQEVFRRKWNV